MPAYSNASGWVRTSDVQSARVSAIAVWSDGGSGHVAIVRAAPASSVTIEEMNWGDPKKGCTSRDSRCYGQTVNFGIATRRTLTFDAMRARGRNGTFRFVGYIHPERVSRPRTRG